MKTFQVIRTHLSPYQAKDFAACEKPLVEAFPELVYRNLNDAQSGMDTILITNTHTQLRDLPAGLLQDTKLIIHPNSGYDHFHIEEDFWKNIPLIIGHSIRAPGVAEYTLACLFEGIAQLPQHLTWNKERDWDRPLLKGLPVWVFGYGHIGSIVADTLAILGCDLTVIDPYTKSPHKIIKNWKQGNLKKAKAVLACLSLNETSNGIFNEEFFAHASDELLFINGARGKLVKEEALKSFLLSHPKSFAFLDVFDPEPFGADWHHFPQAWKTSHIAGVSINLDQLILNFEKDVLHDFLSLNIESFSTKYKKELLQNKRIEGVLI